MSTFRSSHYRNQLPVYNLRCLLTTFRSNHYSNQLPIKRLREDLCHCNNIHQRAMIHTHDVSTAALMSSGLAADIGHPFKVKRKLREGPRRQQKTDDKTKRDPLCRVWRRFPGKNVRKSRH